MKITNRFIYQTSGRAKALRRGSQAKAGLTLIEVTLAMIILGMGLVPILTLAGRSLEIAGLSRQYEDARSLIAYIEMTEPIQLDEIDGTDFEEWSGRFDDPFRRFRWRRTLTRIGEESDNMYAINVRVYWTDRGEKEMYEEVDTLLHLPTAKLNGFIDEDAVDQ